MNPSVNVELLSGWIIPTKEHVNSFIFDFQQEISQEFPSTVYAAINKLGINVINMDTKVGLIQIVKTIVTVGPIQLISIRS